jgi:hypothetical protein
MNVRKGRTPFAPISFRQGTDERGQIASTIWVEESTRLSTKLTLRSHCRTNVGGHPVRVVDPTLVLRGCCRCAGATSTCTLCLGQYVATDMPCSHAKEGAGWEVQQYVSEVSLSEEEPVTEESSEDCEATSDQTEAVEDEAEEAIDELYGPF